MSIVLFGTTRCPLCDQKIREEDDFESFPAFAWSAADPIAVFSDATIHSRCLDNDPRGARVHEIVDEMLARTGPGRRECAVCSSEIEDPDDYLLIPRLTDDPSHPLRRFNYTHLHLSHVAHWDEYETVMPLLRQAAEGWDGDAMDELISALEGAHAAER